MTQVNSFRKLATPALMLSCSFAAAHANAATSTARAAAATTTACATTAATLHGWYGMLISGTTLGSAPAGKYLAGAALFDGAGGISGSNVYGNGGSRSALTGSYSVNADCSVTVDLSIGGSAPQAYTVGVLSNGAALGIEADASAVATISFRPQYATYTPGLNFTGTSLNGTWVTSCLGAANGSSDLNIATFANGNLSGTDPYNNDGSYVGANNPYTGTYTVNSDGTFAGIGLVDGSAFNFYGVIENGGTQVDYFYTNNSNGQPTNAIESCTGGAAPAAPAPGFTLTPAAATLSLRQNMGGTDAITVTPSAGFTGPVSLTVTGAPAGVGTAFSGDTLVVYPPPTTPVGSYPLTITGTSGTVSAKTTVTLVVEPSASFTLSATSASLTATRGTSVADGISVADLNGFTGTVAFTAKGLPAGTTVSFAPASSTTGTVATFATTTATAAGTYSVTISGTSAATNASNAMTQSTVISLTVH
jgi:hypothetical protein